MKVEMKLKYILNVCCNPAFLAAKSNKSYIILYN